MFLEIFDNSIVNGNFQKFGGGSLSKTENLRKNDFVLVIYQTQKKRCFGMVLNIPSKHSVEVKILQRKTVGDTTEFTHKSETFSTKQVMLIYRPEKDKKEDQKL